jgi:hypothetical protein
MECTFPTAGNFLEPISNDANSLEPISGDVLTFSEA